MNPRPKEADGRTADGWTAFTLTELLVVIGILGLLAALLLPALAAAKARGRTIECLGHLSQIGKALTMYENDAGQYPGSGESIQIVGGDVKRTGTSWADQLGQYLHGNPKVFQCPVPEPFDYGALTPPSYGYNAFGTGWVGTGEMLGLGTGTMTGVEYVVVRSQEVRAPADMIALGEMQLPPGVWMDALGPNRHFANALMNTEIAERHLGRANMLLCDGHVETRPQSEWAKATDEARRRWNNDHRPHRETW